MMALPRRVSVVLTDRQRLVLTTLAQFYHATGEAPSVCYIARRLKLSRATIRQHLEALHRKGYIAAPAAPRPRRRG